ncbi:MAG: nucleotidyltransferase family protein [Chloroflexi bacterium]|nr:nucleotidyltransferase family protein [Chloroflexota bacterium]
MDAIVTAGGIPQPDDPLYAYSKGEAKALIDIAGKPMAQWVLDALSGAKNVDNVIMIGLSPKSGLTCKKPIHYISNQGKMLANMIAGVEKSLELNRKNKYVLIVSSDIPAVNSEMIDWLIETCMETEDDIYYGVCPRDVMESRYPGSKRTYTHLKEMDVCGADMNIVHVRMASDHLDTWESLIANRKNPFAQAAIMGWDTLFLLLTRQATLNDFVERVSKRIGIKGRAIVWEHAEPCMDVDKPSQLEMMREDLAKFVKKSARKEKTSNAKPVKKAVAKKPVKKTVVKAKAK